MNINVKSNIDRSRPAGTPVDAGEIHSVPLQIPPQPKVRVDLKPGEESLSLPLPPTSIPGPMEPLTRFLGPVLTVANPAWTGDPVPRMRALQRKLVEHSLTLEESDRADCMAALTVVETAVQWRLRFQQMRMSEAEMDIKPESEEQQ